MQSRRAVVSDQIKAILNDRSLPRVQTVQFNDKTFDFVNDDFITALERNHSITDLDLSKNTLSDAAAQQLASAIPKCSV